MEKLPGPPLAADPDLQPGLLLPQADAGPQGLPPPPPFPLWGAL